MISYFIKAIHQLGDNRVRRVIVVSVVWTLLVYVFLFIGIAWFLAETTTSNWIIVETFLDWGIGVTAAGLTLIFFPGLLSLIISFLLESVADAVETRHYPSLGPSIYVRSDKIIWMSLRLVFLTLALNILILPFYLVPVLNICLFYTANGLLLGREYFGIVAARRLDGPAMRAMRKQNFGVLTLAGMMTTVLLTIPFVNLVAPIIGIATMVHLFHSIAAKEDRAQN